MYSHSKFSISAASSGSPPFNFVHISMIPSIFNMKSTLSIHNGNLCHLNLRHVSMLWASIQICQELLDAIILALGFAFYFALRNIPDPTSEAIGSCFLLGEVSEGCLDK
jgi:hypothetical protein